MNPGTRTTGSWALTRCGPAYGSTERARRSSRERRSSRAASDTVLASRASARTPDGPPNPGGTRKEPSGELILGR